MLSNSKKNSENPAKRSSRKGPADSLRAQVALKPTLQAAATIREYDNVVGNLELAELDDELTRQVEAVEAGAMRGVEAILVAQTMTLDSLFQSLCRRANANRNDLNAFERLFRLALKSQSQSRATAEALGRLKNPQPVAFVRQANIAGGHQVVNNGASLSCSHHAQEIQIAPNELLEGMHGEWLDAGAPGKASCADPAMATLGEVNRPKEPRG